MGCRIGGDEFACLLLGELNDLLLDRIAAKLLAAVAAPLRIGALRLSVRPSIGIANWPERGKTLGALVANADAGWARPRCDAKSRTDKLCRSNNGPDVIELRGIEAFHWSAMLGGFRAAAKKLHASHSAVSQRIAQLEEALGARLFDPQQRRHAALDARAGTADARRAHAAAEGRDEQQEVGAEPTIHARVQG